MTAPAHVPTCLVLIPESDTAYPPLVLGCSCGDLLVVEEPDARAVEDRWAAHAHGVTG